MIEIKIFCQCCDLARAKELAHFAEHKQLRGFQAAKLQQIKQLTK